MGEIYISLNKGIGACGACKGIGAWVDPEKTVFYSTEEGSCASEIFSRPDRDGDSFITFDELGQDTWSFGELYKTVTNASPGDCGYRAGIMHGTTLEKAKEQIAEQRVRQAAHAKELARMERRWDDFDAELGRRTAGLVSLGLSSFGVMVASMIPVLFPRLGPMLSRGRLSPNFTRFAGLATFLSFAGLALTATLLTGWQSRQVQKRYPDLHS